MNSASTSQTTRSPVPTRTLRQIAVLADCDERTARKYVSGLPVIPACRERIERALRELAAEPRP